jgi:prepilin-type N-terminal cleavage/methylation domain-containing protein
MIQLKHKRRRGGLESGMTLVEVLIGMVIMSIITAMILVTWFALSRSYSYSATSFKTRDHAREAVARMEREIRDAQSKPGTTETALIRARPLTVVVSTTFNMAENANPAVNPRLVMFRLYPDGELWRFYDVNDSGTIAHVDMNSDDWPANTNHVAEQVNGEGARLLVSNVVNDRIPSTCPTCSTTSPTALFHYSYYEADGDLVQDTRVLGTENRRRVVSVQISLLVDLNPAHSPIYTEFQTSAQLRNQQ